MTNQGVKTESVKSPEMFGKRIRRYVLELIAFIEALPSRRTVHVIADQLMRSGTSIGANYFEAKSASSRKDFINFFTHALKSANESKFWIETLIDSGECQTASARKLFCETSEIANILASSILTLKGQR